MAAASGYRTWPNVYCFLKTGGHIALSGATIVSADVFGSGKLVDVAGWDDAQAEAEKESSQSAATVGNLVPDPTELPEFTETPNSISVSVAGRSEQHNQVLASTLGDWSPQILFNRGSAAHNRIADLAKGARVQIGLGMYESDTNQSVWVVDATLSVKTPVFPADDFVRMGFTFAVNKVHGWVDRA